MLFHRPVTQLVESLPENQNVVGSIPTMTLP